MAFESEPIRARGITILLIIVPPLASKEGKDLDIADYEESIAAILSVSFLLILTSAVSCCIPTNKILSFIQIEGELLRLHI